MLCVVCSNMTTAKEFRFPEVGSNRMMPPMMMHHHQPPQPISRNALVITGSLAEHDVAAGACPRSDRRSPGEVLMDSGLSCVVVVQG